MRVWFQLLHCLKFFHQTSDLSDSAALTGNLKAKSNVSNGQNGNVTMKNQMAEKNLNSTPKNSTPFHCLGVGLGFKVKVRGWFSVTPTVNPLI